VAGRISIPQNKWISLYGGPVSDSKDEDVSSNNGGDESGNKEPREKPPSPTGSIRGKLKTGINALLPSSPGAEDDPPPAHNVKQKQKGWCWSYFDFRFY
jgi:hypothetical protein